MKTIKSALALLFACAFVTVTVSAQPAFSLNVVGYYNLNISVGDNLISSQFQSTDPNNGLDTVLTNGVAVGSTFSAFDPTAHQLLPASVYDGSAWSINYSFGPNGLGGVLDSPTVSTVTFVGTVVNYDVDGPLGYTFVPPAYGPGEYLLSLAAPLTNGTFQEFVGRAPHVGDSFTTLDGPSQEYSTTTFNGTQWSNGDPSLTVGQAAYFNLAPAPEPSTLAMFGLGAAGLAIYRRRISKTLLAGPKTCRQ